MRGMDRTLEPGRGRSRGEGISEVIGFLLILAVIIASISLYLLYVMPAMGRENEIARMNGVKEAFTEYKLNIDTLWTSRQCTSDFGPALSIGSGESAGVLSYFPFFSPPKASGVLALNQRPENITISYDSYFTVSSAGYNESGNIAYTPTSLNVNATPGHIYINISTTDLRTGRGIFVDGSDWDVWLNISPNYDYTNRFNITLHPTLHNITNFWNWTEYVWNSTDVTVTTLSAGSTVSVMPVYRNIVTTRNYTVDLMSPVYGVSTKFQNARSFNLSLSDNSGLITGRYDVRYGFVPRVTTSTLPLGSIEFRSNNIWYTPQTYYYQLGGVFLEQEDGSTNEIPPAVSISYVNSSPVVSIGDILILGGVTSTNVSGSGPITVASAVTDATAAALPAGNNTRWVNITIQAASANAAQMWQNTLTSIAGQGGLPVSAYTNGTSGNYAFINITGNPNLYDIKFSLTQVNLSADYVDEYSTGEVSRYWRNVPGFSLPTDTITPATTATTAIPTITPTATPTLPPGSVAWYDCNWAHRKNITIDKRMVNGTLTDFPVLINFTSDSDLASYAKTNGQDILFTDSSGNKLSHEIELYQPGTGGLTAWVKIASLSNAANTSIYMYYGNSAATPQWANTSVWSNGYAAVWHLGESGSGAAGEFKDSTSNANHGQGASGLGYGNPVRMAGKFGYGQNFTSESNQFIEVPNTASLQLTGPLTIEGWINGAKWTPTQTGENYRGVVGKQYGSGGDDSYIISIYCDGSNPTTPYTWFTGITSVSDGNIVSTGSWYFIATNLSAGGNAVIHVNGVAQGAGCCYSVSEDANNVTIGAEECDATLLATERFAGKIDEVRLSNVARSAGWIWTQYQNQNSPTTFEYRMPQESSSCAPAFVQAQGTNSQSGNQLYITLPGMSTAGNLMVVSFSMSTASSLYDVTSITDTKGNAYTLAAGPTDWSVGGKRGWTYYASNIAGGGSPITITITLSGNPSNSDTYAAEYSGIATSSPLDQSSAATGSGNNLNSGSKTTTQASELIFGFGMSSSAVTADAPYTNQNNFDSNFIGDQIVSSTGSYQVTGSAPGGGNWLCQMTTFKGK
jgi:hypothetical protein